MAGYTKEEIEAQRRMDAMVEEYGRSNEQPPVENFSGDYLSKPETYEPFRMRGVESPAPSENRLPSTVRSEDMSRRKDITREYQDPSDDLLQNVPEGVTYPAPSLAPKELRKPGVTFMADRNPMDWKKGDGSDVERSQRYKVRTYLEQLYGDAAKTGEIEQARTRSDNINQMANIGYGLDRMFMAHSAARGGPGADANFWEGMKRDGRGGVENAVQDRDQKIKNYLTKMKLGSEGVKEQQDMLDFDNKNKRRDPESDISISYRSQFRGMFPEYADKFMAVDPNTGDEYNTLDTMTADEIEQAAKMVQAQAQNQISNSLKSSQIDLAKSKMENDRGELGIKQQDANTRMAKAGMQPPARPARPGAPAAPGAKPAGAPMPVRPSKAYEALDRDYVKKYNDWTTEGRPMFEKNRTLLQKSLDKLRNVKGDGSNISGRGVGFANKYFDGLMREEDSLTTQSDVEQAAIGGLKATMGGGQITDDERKAYLSKVYDPKLSVKSNISKIESELQALEERAAAEDAKARYFEENGTLSGFRGASIQKPAPSPAPSPTPTPTSGPKPGTVEDGHVFLGGDPSNPKNWRKAQ